MVMNFRKINQFAKENFLLVLLILASFVLLFCLSTYFFIFDQKIDWPTQTNHVVSDKAFRSLDGVLVPRENKSLKPVAVMLENHVESRPAVGLEYASLIYEMIIEGDVTRFLAIFDLNNLPEKIGPVRSARPFFIDLAQEWNPVYFHAGGSQAALQQLKTSLMYNINEVSVDGIYFWRDKMRLAPHNLFTSSELIKRAIMAKEIDTQADFLPWLFKKEGPEKDETKLVKEIKVDFFGNPLYQVKYQYNQATNDYTRYLAGKIHKTDQGIILKTKNIVLQYVDFKIIDDYGRLDVDLTSGGRAEVYRDGKKIDGFWKKSAGRTKFYNQENQEIEFNSGMIWLELLFN